MIKGRTPYPCGHPRTPDNTQFCVWIARCLICNREKAREGMRRAGAERRERVQAWIDAP